MNEHPTDEESVEPDETVAETVEVTDVETGDDSGEDGVEAPAEESEDTEDETVATGTRLILKRSGVETDIVFAFTAPASVGRFDPSVGPIDIDLGEIEEAGYVSRNHAKITEEDGSFKIQDLGSSNGTYVLRDDFEKIDEAEITDGDEIAFGNARFVFRV